MARRLWPKLRSKRPKAVTVEQHHALIAAVKDPEFRHFLQMLWEIGGSQTDTARLHWDNIGLGESPPDLHPAETRIRRSVQRGHRHWRRTYGTTS